MIHFRFILFLFLARSITWTFSSCCIRCREGRYLSLRQLSHLQTPVSLIRPDFSNINQITDDYSWIPEITLSNYRSCLLYSSNLKDFMIDSIKWYKTNLSPIMPPNCRFLPTCSSYGIEAIDKFGPIRGGILTIWRIFRCNPTGGTGFDPPVWPPPSYFAGSTTKKPF